MARVLGRAVCSRDFSDLSPLTESSLPISMLASSSSDVTRVAAPSKVTWHVGQLVHTVDTARGGAGAGGIRCKESGRRVHALDSERKHLINMCLARAPRRAGENHSGFCPNFSTPAVFALDTIQ